MRHFCHPFGVTAFAVALWLGSVSTTRAGDILYSKCSDHSTKSKGSTNLSGGAGVVYLPLAGGATTTATTIATVNIPTPAAEHNPLATAHEAELAMVRHERAKAALKAEVDASQRVLVRMAAASDCNSCQNGNGDLAKINAQLTDLSNKMSAIDTRLTAVEKLLITHDNFIRDMIDKKAFTPQPKLPNQ